MAAQVCVFEPTPLLAHSSPHGLDYWWVQTAQLDLECRVNSLAWNQEGTRLLTAGEVIQMWFCPDLEQQQQPHSATNNNRSGAHDQDDGPKSSVVFTIGGAPNSASGGIPPPNTAPPAINGHASVSGLSRDHACCCYCYYFWANR